MLPQHRRDGFKGVGEFLAAQGRAFAVAHFDAAVVA